MGGLASCWKRGGWGSSRASAIPIRTARTSGRWRSGSRASRRTTPRPSRPAGWAGPSIRRAANRATIRPPCTSAAGRCPRRLRSRKTEVPALESLESYKLRLTGAEPDRKSERSALNEVAAAERKADDPLLGFIRQTTLSAYESSSRLEQVGQKAGGPKYPNFGLARRLELVAQMIKAGFGTRIFYTSLDGFDTHANQLGTHAALLNELSDSIAAFHDDLATAGQADRVVVLTFSEFGRRVAENASLGTDHGAAAPVLLVGPVAKAGLVGAHPTFDDLDDGDLKYPHRFPTSLCLAPRRLARLPSAVSRRRRLLPLAALAQGVSGQHDPEHTSDFGCLEKKEPRITRINTNG